MVPKYRVQSRLVLLFALMAALIWAGCIGAAASRGTSESATADIGASSSLYTSGTSQDGLTDTDAIVAAQEEALGRIYQAALPAVVHIRVTQKVSAPPGPAALPDGPGFPSTTPRPPQEFFQQGEASGFVWDEQGHVVTNYHVIEGATSVTAIFADGTEVAAKVLGADPDSDLAVLQVELANNPNPLPHGDSDALKVGQLAVAIGNPFGQEFTMTSGIISALGRVIPSANGLSSIPEAIQTDAAINPGNSGGPLLSRQGQVIGINDQIISSSGANDGIGFAVPINIAKRVVPDLIRDGHHDYPWLGISGGTISSDLAAAMGLPRETRGALVNEVTRGGPADQEGLKGSEITLTIQGQPYPLGGDVIVAINGAPIKGMNDLMVYLVRNTRPGDKVTLDILRGHGEQQKIEVTLGKRAV